MTPAEKKKTRDSRYGQAIFHLHRINNGWGERSVATQYPIHPDMRVEHNHFAQFQSSIGATGERMSPSIFPLPAIRC